MKICFISGALPDVSCGIGDYTDALARALARKGHEIVVLTTASPELRFESSYHAIPLTTTWSLREAGRVAAAVRCEHPDVLHLQFPGTGYGRGFGACFAPWAVRLRGSRPLLATTLHEFRTYRLRHRARLALAASTCDLIIAPDPRELASIKGHIRWRPGLDLEMIPIAANVWPLALASQQSAPQRDRALVVGYWGFLRPDKGVELLLEAFDRVRRTRQARLVIAGDAGPETEYAASILRRVEDLGISADTRYTGKLSAEELSGVLQSFDACVLPFRDGLGQNRGTYAAATAHGLYVVTTGVNRTGYEAETNTAFVAPRDVDALAAAILDAQDHPRRLTTTSPGVAWDEIAERHLAAYARVRGKRRPPGGRCSSGSSY